MLLARPVRALRRGPDRSAPAGILCPVGDELSTDRERVVAVSAASGDEAALTAALATLVNRGAAVTLVRCLEPDDDGRSALAAAALGVTDVRVLGAPTARWTGRPERRYQRSAMPRQAGEIDTASTVPNPDAFAVAEPGEAAADIASVLIAENPDVVIAVAAPPRAAVPTPADADRVRVAEAVQTACDVMGIPLYLAVDGRGDVTIDPGPVLESRRAALDALGSAVDPAAPEQYRRDLPGEPRRFADLHVSTRIIAGVVVFVFAVIVGAVLTAAHQATVLVRDVPVPWGVVLGLIVATCLFAGLRLATGTRLLAGLAVLGFLAAEGVLALQSVGGSVIVPDNTLGYVWTAGPVLIAFVVLAWPQVTRPARDRLVAQPRAKGLDSK